MNNSKIKASFGVHVARVMFYAFMVIVCLATFGPLILTLVNATRSPIEIRNSISLLPGKALKDNIIDIYTFGLDPVRAMLNSLVVAGSYSVLSLYASCMMAYSLTVYQYKLRNLFSTFILLVLMVPGGVMIVGYYKMLNNIGIMNNLWALILPGMAAPSCVYFMRSYMRGALPLEIVDSGRIDGASEFSIFNRLSLPILMPAVATQMIFTFVGSWNNFLVPSLIITDLNKITLPVMVNLLRDDHFTNTDGARFVGIAAAIIPVSIMYTFLSRFIIKGIALGSVKG